MQPHLLLDGLAMPESPRWHEGRLWFSNWGNREIVAVNLDGVSDVVGEGPDGLGWATNWLPDGRLLITGTELIRVERDGARVRHADLSHISPFGWSELTVDGRGNSAAPTVGRCSCSRPTGAAPKESRMSSRREQDKCSWPTRPPPASAGRNR
jgi:sugar lactone lactonase YvrE